MAKNIYGVLTGDLVDYSKLDEKGRIQYVNNLRAILNKLGTKDLVFEIFRGDSFQAVLPSSREALKVALIIRSYIISHKLDSKKKIKPDVRIAVGIGNIENYNENNISSSDGEAFRNSGPELDRMNKKRQRLIIKTNWSEVNKELKTECALLDALISKWTSVQTETIYYSLLDFSQNEIAEMQNVSQGNISTRLNSANFQAVKEMINRYTELIDGGVVHIFLNKMDEIDVAPGLKCLATRHPDYPVFHRESASDLSNTGNYGASVGEYTNALDKNPGDSKIRTDLISALREIRNNVDVQSEIKISQSLDPEDSNSYFDLGQILLSKEDYEGAANNLKKSIALNPQNPHAYFLLGMSEYALGNTGQARIQFKKAHEMDLNLPEAEKILSDLNSGSFEEGEL